MASTNLEAKEAVGKAAADLIESGMLVGLGTGSTAQCFIAALIERVRTGLHISAIATSEESAAAASKGGIRIREIDDFTRIDITVDGADEIDHQLRMIKGGGGALLKEKIVAAMSDQVLIIVDNNKVVKQLGGFPLPVEIVPFGFRSTIAHLEKHGYHGKLRHSKTQGLFITENSNYIYDIKLESKNIDPEEVEWKIKQVPGVVETGFFFRLATKALVGFPDGRVEILS